jgi:uncharacterized protein YfaS (alpha-2-macroglobulin family)
MWVIAGVCLGLTGCPTPTDELAATGSGTIVESAEQPTTESGVEVEIRHMGLRHAAPEYILVAANRMVFRRYGSTEMPAGTSFTIEPEQPGTVRVLSWGRFEFTPDGPWIPDTEYTFTIAAIGDDESHVPDTPWVHRFTTPEFGVHSMRVTALNMRTRSALVELSFTGPVAPDEVARRLSATIDGRPVTVASVLAGVKDSVVRFEVRGHAVQVDASLEVDLDAGVPLDGRPEYTAGPFVDAEALVGGEAVEILDTVVREGSSGYVLDIICRDRAVEETDYYWDRDNYESYQVSKRCLIDGAEAASGIRITPHVDIEVAQGPGGFRLFGDFTRGEYELTIVGGTRTVDGGLLKANYTAKVVVPSRSPSVRFLARGRYIPRNQWDRLAIRHVNVSKATVLVRHVPESNIPFWLSGAESMSDRQSDPVAKHEVKLQDDEDADLTSWIDLAQLVPRPDRGVYEITVRHKTGKDVVRLVRTDLQVIAKRGAYDKGEETVDVWVVDAHTGGPRPDVTVKLLQMSGKPMGTCLTDLSGWCAISRAADPSDDRGATTLIVSDGDDVTFVSFDDLELEPDGPVQGVPYQSTQAYTAAVYLDRGVYRPGDTAHVSVALRDAAFGDYATTGPYRVDVRVGKKTVGGTEFKVEEFVPERMAVEARAAEEGSHASDPIALQIAGRWLFGGNASGSRVEIGCTVRPGTFSSNAHPDYHFGLSPKLAGKTRPVNTGEAHGTLGEEGEAVVSCPPIGTAASTMGSAIAVADVRVFEGESGRTTRAIVRTPVHPEHYYLGLRADATQAEAGHTVTVSGLVVDWSGERWTGSGGPSEVDVTAYRLESEYGYGWDEAEGTAHYHRYLRRVSIGTGRVPASNGRFSWSFAPNQNAVGYLISARSGETRTELHIDGTGGRYWWGDGRNQVNETPKPGRPTGMTITAPERASVGEQVQVTATAPYAGRLLWTVETDEVLHQAWADVGPGEVTWTFPIDEFVPNLYVSGLLIKDPHLESAEAFLPDRAHGVANIIIEPTAFVQAVTLTVPEEVRPRSTLKVRIDVGAHSGPMVATIAAVDEGILSLTDFEDPDPLRQIFANRALGVRTYETLGWTVLRPPSGTDSTTGGDGDSGGGRVQMVRPVALWSGPVDIPASGQVDIALEVPAYRGQLRVMAVVVGPNTLGHASASVPVREPLVLQTTTPRVLVRGDTARIPVYVDNMSGAAQTVTVGMSIAGLDPTSAPVEMVGRTEASLDLAEGEGDTVVFEVRTVAGSGAARFRVTAKGGGHSSLEEITVPVMHPSPEVRRTSRVKLGTGKTDLRSAVSGWVKGTDRTTFWVTTNPYADSLNHLHYLVRYPYGCVEQTTSSTRPLIYLSRLLGEIGDEIMPTDADGKVQTIDALVAAGIDRIMSMQTPSGGFGYWPGDDHPQLWGTAYATHMLLDASEAGHSVPGEALQSATDWLNRRLQSQGTTPRADTAYPAYVLARSGYGEAARVSQIMAELDEREDRNTGKWAEARYLWMAALHHYGDRRYEDELSTLDVTPLVKKRGNDWSFYSNRRRRAMTLGVYQDLFGPDADSEPLASLVAESISGPAQHYATQELSWAITALGRRVLDRDAAIDPPELRVGDQKFIGDMRGRDWAWTVHSASTAERVTVSTSGDVATWALVTTQGVRANEPTATGGKGLRLRREYIQPDGKPLDLAHHNLGDTVLVRLTIENPEYSAVQNVALVDRVPAGWEIDNPRLTDTAPPDFLDEDKLWDRQHMNVRDDRIEVFGALPGRTTRQVVYAVRAVSAGTFTAPSPSAEAMYDPDIWAREPSSQITVHGPWGGSVL